MVVSIFSKLNCQCWDVAYDGLFYAGHVVLGAGFVFPQKYAYSLLTLRGALVTGDLHTHTFQKSAFITKLLLRCRLPLDCGLVTKQHFGAFLLHLQRRLLRDQRVLLWPPRPQTLPGNDTQGAKRTLQESLRTNEHQ